MGLLAAARKLLDGLVNRLTSFTCALLNSANQQGFIRFVLAAREELLACPRSHRPDEANR